ncbi:DUF262 domain-containing protein [Dysgonomonas sp. HDW5B]|uniref:DUF262 domain-containing protein n=1 Tax=Dysgonomonas sp. HDW5B TaxID=2714927 RepID=UPI00140ACA3F|nr:DUF262 domain-containing protein [Dysgonomonas sp. HDW5B]QIK53116.1 DUF262 domain-containing protein [Dysgonomonas sp. HDW5B]
MQTGKNTMRGLFDGSKIFNIPIYQRAYSWGEQQLTDFLNDIVNQRHDNLEGKERQYFLGTFLFHKVGKVKDFQQYDVIDGQQRLTTFAIFILSLLSELESRCSDLATPRQKRTYIIDEDFVKLVLSNEDSAFFKAYIIEDNSPINIEYTSQKKLIFAKAFFREEFKKLDIAILSKLFNTATQSEILIYVVDEVSSATQIFELLNDRGKKLTDLEAIKSFLMYNLNSVSSNPDDLIKDVQSHFSSVYRIIENNRLNPSDEIDILRYHTIVFNRNTDLGGKEYLKQKISKLVTAEKDYEAKNFIINYPKELRESFELYVKIRFNKLNLKELDDLIEIGRVAPFYPMMMYCLSEQPHLFKDLIEELKRFTFRAVFIGLRSNAESYINSAVKNRGDDILGIIKPIVRDNWWNLNQRAVDVLNYNNYYEWLNKNIIKYILFKYENSLRKVRGFSELTIANYYDDDSRTKLNIEHISAQRAKGINYDDDFIENYEHSIGNLVIDSTASNSRKNNANTNHKSEEFKMAPLMSQNEIDTQSVDWTDLEAVKQYLEKRNATLRNFIKTELMN